MTDNLRTRGTPRLQVKNLQCSAGTRILFEDLNLELFDGQCLLLMGRNGSGKTTLLRSLAGLTRPTQGTIDWHAVSDGHLDDGNIPTNGGRRLYQGHHAGWKAELSGRENLTIQIRLDEGKSDPESIVAALARAGIDRQADLAFGRLSAGQRRRLALARLMLDSRMVWLLDEPATALDEQGLQLLTELLDQKLANQGLVIAATHQNLGLKQAVVRLNLSELEQTRA